MFVWTTFAPSDASLLRRRRAPELPGLPKRFQPSLDPDVSPPDPSLANVRRRRDNRAAQELLLTKNGTERAVRCTRF